MKKVLIFIGALVLVLLITIGLPNYMFNKYTTSTYYTQVKNDDGVMIPNTMYLTNKIGNELSNPNDISNLTKEYQNILNGKGRDFMNLFITLGIAVFLCLAFSATVLMKYNNKLLGTVFIIASIVNLLYYIAMCYLAVMLKLF